MRAPATIYSGPTQALGFDRRRGIEREPTERFKGRGCTSGC
jgi:hypothetical protein